MNNENFDLSEKIIIGLLLSGTYIEDGCAVVLQQPPLQLIFCYKFLISLLKLSYFEQKFNPLISKLRVQTF